MEPDENQEHPQSPASDPQPGWALPGSSQSTLKSWVEIAVVFGGFCGWLGLQGATPLGQWLTSLFAGSPVYGQIVCNGFVAIALVAGVTVAGRSTPAGLGLVRGRIGRDLGLGFLVVIPAYCWTAVVSIVLTVLAAQLGDQPLETIAEQKMQMLEMVGTISPLMVVPLTLLIGFYEELLFRGFLLGRLVSLTRSTTLAVILSSLAFGLMHLPSQGVVGFLQTSLLGAILALLAIWRKSLWSAMACHAGIDMVGIFLVLIITRLTSLLGG